MNELNPLAHEEINPVLGANQDTVSVMGDYADSSREGAKCSGGTGIESMPRALQTA